METFLVMYYFEHELLPRCFFEGKEKFVKALLLDPVRTFRPIIDILSKNSSKKPYSEEDFRTEIIKVTADITMIKISFQEPEMETLCYSIYLLFDTKFEKTGFFCLEKGSHDAMPFLCSRTPNGSHINHGHCSAENNEDVNRCVDIFLGRQAD